MEAVSNNGFTSGLSWTCVLTGKITKEDIELVKGELKAAQTPVAQAQDIFEAIAEIVSNFFYGTPEVEEKKIALKSVVEEIKTRRSRVYPKVMLTGFAAGAALLAARYAFNNPSSSSVDLLNVPAKVTADALGSIGNPLGEGMSSLSGALGYVVAGYTGLQLTSLGKEAVVLKLKSVKNSACKVVADAIASLVEFVWPVVGVPMKAAKSIAKFTWSAITFGPRVCMGGYRAVKGTWSALKGEVNKEASSVQKFVSNHRTKLIVGGSYLAWSLVAPNVFPK